MPSWTLANKRKYEQLGMPFATAAHRLRRMIMFQLAQKLNLDRCLLCDQPIVSVDQLSIHHIVPWLDNDSALFWDLGNVGFAHKSCNYKDGQKHSVESRLLNHSRGRAKSSWSRGSQVPSAKLTEAQVRIIRSRYKPGKSTPCELRDRYRTGDATAAELAKEFGVSTRAIVAVVKYESWKHVE